MIPPKGSIPPDIRVGISFSGSSINRKASKKNFSRNINSTWKKPKPKIKRERYPRNIIADVFDEPERFLVIIDFPYHTEKDFHYEIDNENLIIKSKLFAFNYTEKFTLSENVLVNSMQTFFHNGILKIDFKKKGEKQKK